MGYLAADSEYGLRLLEVFLKSGSPENRLQSRMYIVGSLIGSVLDIFSIEREGPKLLGLAEKKIRLQYSLNKSLRWPYI